MPKENHTKYAILGLLTTSCRSGYSIKKMIDTSLNHFWKISYGQVYPTLKTLVQEGLAEVDNTNDLDKKEYSITEKGKQELTNWLQLPVEKLSVEKNELLLKLFFSSQLESQSPTFLQLEAYEQKLHERLEVYRNIQSSIETYSAHEQDAIYWLITLDYGIKTTLAQIEWCSCTQEKIKKGVKTNE
ncbi:putative transcriptional regulator [Bacillus sp. TS-2]|nr:putative transcriptional regulator [Bacillus sp. TS-2]